MNPRSKTAVRRTLHAFALATRHLRRARHGPTSLPSCNFLGAWLVQLETQHDSGFTPSFAILLIIGQAVVLELLRPACCDSCAGGRSE